MKRGLGILCTTAALLSLAGVGLVTAEPPAAETAPVEPEGEAVAIRGMQVFIDAESGQLRPPTAKEAAMMSKMMEQMFGKRKFEPKLNVDKDGVGSVELGESFMEFSMARIEADGSLSTDCVDGIEGAREWVAKVANAGLEEE